MSSLYETVREDNIKRFGTDIARVGKLLLEERYDERAHFILELLQNAEDALARLPPTASKNGRVAFELKPNGLCVSHYGRPFDENDFRSICSIGESTKATDPSRLGRFGIGFKSVYAITDSPEIHSGELSFTIESYVWPKEVEKRVRGEGETLFWFPFREADASKAFAELKLSFEKLPVRTVLFLHHVEEVEWKSEDGAGATYRRQTTQCGPEVRQVAIEGARRGAAIATGASWLIFRRPVNHPVTGNGVGAVELAFHLHNGAIVPFKDSCLAVFFPTIVPTGFGAICQGPYRTTPSRDNVLREDSWNRTLIRETALLVRQALVQLRDQGLMTPAVMAALPLDAQFFSANPFFQPIYQATLTAFKEEALIPVQGGLFAVAGRVRLARSADLRELFSSAQLGQLLGRPDDIHWVSGEITHDRLNEVRTYLMGPLNVTEMTAATIIPRLTPEFLAQQSDEWMVQLYRLFGIQESLLPLLAKLAIVRLEDGTHVPPFRATSLPCAFLPGATETNFPTVRRAIARDPHAAAFLARLGLKVPDPVDDVIQNILPRYDGTPVSPEIFAADFKRMLDAYQTDSKSMQHKLVVALGHARFVPCRSLESEVTQWKQPARVYQRTERLERLFRGVPGVSLVDPSFEALRGESARDLLEVCGASRYLMLEPDSPQQPEMRTIVGLSALLRQWPSLPEDDAIERSRVLWEALCDLVTRRGKEICTGTYSWSYYGPKSESRDAPFVTALQTSAWISLPGTGAHKPEQIVLEDLQPGWEFHPILQTRLKFKPRIIVDLATQVGLDPAVLDLLKAEGLTTLEALKAKLGIANTPGAGGHPNGSDPGSGANQINSGASGSSSGHGNGNGSSPHSASGSHSGNSGQGGDNSKREFVSYLRVSRDGDEDDESGEGLSRERRLEVEREAIKFIRSKEQQLKTTPENNPGFDLYEGDSKESATRYVEVKAKSGAWVWPATMSETQFRRAIAEGPKYWLYVVENVATPDKMRLHRIHDPASLVRYFAFDRGWAEAASPDSGPPS